jgi:signal transduction histidine kinase
MSPEVQKKIFSSYFTTKPQGTGLGLAGARRSIQAQGGEIKFESAPGRGTTFYVTLPTVGAEEEKTPERRRRAS